MNRFSGRSISVEIMDDLTCSGAVVHQTLRELDFINRWLGGNKVTLDALKKILHSLPTPIHLADLGCGSGEMFVQVHRTFPGKRFVFHGVDANPNIIAYAQQHVIVPHAVHWHTTDVLSSEFTRLRFDVVVATLFFHHFTTAQLVALLTSLRKQTNHAIVINDLHRHPLAYYSIAWLTRIFSRSAMVKIDAPLSVLRGFSRSEWKEILQQAGITRYTLQWKWAFRWQLIIITGSQTH